MSNVLANSNAVDPCDPLDCSRFPVSLWASTFDGASLVTVHRRCSARDARLLLECRCPEIQISDRQRILSSM